MTDTKLPTQIRIGTRGSPLAMAQAHETRDRLQEAHPGLTVEIVEIKTTGDMILDRKLAEIGGKGLFTKELDEALLDGRIDIGVHSMKDLETWLPEGTEIVAVLPREDVRDALITSKAGSLADLAPGSVVGTASLRRQAQILAKRPDLNVVTFRGNVQTRLRKLSEGEADATLLAMAGLNRLGMSDVAAAAIEPEEMLPAVAQGAIAITARTGDEAVQNALQALHDESSAQRVTAERAFLTVLDGSCRTPIAGLATLSGDKLHLRGLIAKPDGQGVLTVERHGPAQDAEAIGLDAGRELKDMIGDDYQA